MRHIAANARDIFVRSRCCSPRSLYLRSRISAIPLTFPRCGRAFSCWRVQLSREITPERDTVILPREGDSLYREGDWRSSLQSCGVWLSWMVWPRETMRDCNQVTSLRRSTKQTRATKKYQYYMLNALSVFMSNVLTILDSHSRAKAIKSVFLSLIFYVNSFQHFTARFSSLVE